MSLFLGIDTSNYTTSMALCENGKVICNLKMPVFVEDGKCGTRQSDAVFSHTKNIPELSRRLGEYTGKKEITAIGVSSKPRDVSGSYMPCFLSGVAVASALSGALNVPLYEFSHQRGHIYSALYSSGKEELYGGRFIAFHVSGGTTEVLLVNGEDIALIGGTLDLTAGQLIDRTGVALGLKFPCGAELEKLAKAGAVPKVKTSITGGYANMSGAQNIAEKMQKAGSSREDIARFVIEFILKTLDGITKNLLKEYGSLPLLFSGGVMSCSMIKEYFEKKYGAYFALPEYSSDNASGIALLTELQYSHK